MASHRDILLVGSVPLDTSDAVFRLLASKLGSDAKRYPDGVTGERRYWIRWQRHVFDESSAMELVDPHRLLAGYTDGLARPFYRVRERVDPNEIQFGKLGFADVAIESYGVFAGLKAKGVIPAETRFQISLPTVVALLTGFIVKEDRAKVEPALEDAMRREIAAMTNKIPRRELSIQWDVCMEIVGYDGGYDLHYADILTAAIASICRQVDFVPKDAEVGIHLCYGDPGHKHVLEPTSTGTCVIFSNAMCRNAKRGIDWIHIPVPRGRSDAAYFAPLADLATPPETEIYLGLVHATDGVPGTRARIAAAEPFLGSFGLATECGFGRRSAEAIPGLLDIHREAAIPFEAHAMPNR
jgi:hypothetical protein